MVLKKWIYFIILLFSLPAAAQSDSGKNMVKINVSAFVFKGINVQYERQISGKVTVALSAGLIPLSSIPYKSYINKHVFIPDVDLAAFSLGTSVFTPEVRYYFGKKGAFHGLYIAPYARISNYKIKGPILYTTDAGSKQSAEFTGKLSAASGGIMVGSAWQISKKFYMDVWIIGASIGGESGKFTASSLQLTQQEQESLRKRLNSISLYSVTLKSEVSSTGAVVKSSGGIAGLRGLGLNFGIRF